MWASGHAGVTCMHGEGLWARQEFAGGYPTFPTCLVKMCKEFLRCTNRVGWVPADAADIPAFRFRALIGPETVEVWTDVSHDQFNLALFFCCLVTGNCSWRLINVYIEQFQNEIEAQTILAPLHLTGNQKSRRTSHPFPFSPLPSPALPFP